MAEKTMQPQPGISFGPAVLLAGPEPAQARAALILLHGRGANAAGMKPLADALAVDGLAVVAPEAASRTWYPDRFLVPPDQNEPQLSAALQQIGQEVQRLVGAGVRLDRIALAGFSQGACLALEFAARHPGRWAVVAAFAGALIGPDPMDGGYAGDLVQTPVLLAAGTADAHVPPEFVSASNKALSNMNANVTMNLRVGMGHGIHPEDVEWLRIRLSDITKIEQGDTTR